MCSCVCDFYHVGQENKCCMSVLCSGCFPKYCGFLVLIHSVFLTYDVSCDSALDNHVRE